MLGRNIVAVNPKLESLRSAPVRLCPQNRSTPVGYEGRLAGSVPEAEDCPIAGRGPRSRLPVSRPFGLHCLQHPTRGRLMPRGKVYVIDDDEAMRHSLEFLLGSADFDVALFESAQAFLDSLS